MDKTYICIDLKSFYASVECVERGLDPMTTNLAVCDMSRSEKTICLAITPAMKALGIKNRCRVFEIPKTVKFIAAPPRMQLYLEYSANIYAIYLKYISKDDIHVYSVDEAFMDVTDYLSLYKMTARELGQAIIDDIYTTLGIRATCGIGTNLYLTKIALDITAKHAKDFIGELNEEKYIAELWDHTPLTDFWMIGPGTAKRLAAYGIHTMGDIAHTNEDTLYHMFGINAELLIDHAYGREPVTIADIKKYKPSTRSLTSGQVLMRDYDYEDALLICKEMMDLLCLDMVEKGVVTQSLTLHVCYSNTLDIPPAHGSTTIETPTNADILLIPAISELFARIVEDVYPVRRIYIYCNNLQREEFRQYNLFIDDEALQKNRKIQEAVISIKKKYGKNAILKGMNLEKNATTMLRNNQIGGHSAEGMAMGDVEVNSDSDISGNK